MLHVCLLTPNAKLPERKTSGNAGYDLFSTEPMVIPAGKQVKIPTGISLRLPEDTYGRIAPRSSLANSHKINVHGGVIDRDYSQEVLVMLFNHGEEDYHVQEGDRIAQLIIERISTPQVVSVTRLPPAIARHDGFGSTGR